MNGQNVPPALPPSSASHQYLIMSLAGLGVMLLVLLHWGMERWSFLPVLIGAMGVTLRWRITPLLTLIVLAGLLLASETTPRPMLPGYLTRRFSLADWLLCGALLALCIAQYRIVGLVTFPVRRGKRHRERANTSAGKPAPRPKTDRQQGTPRMVSPLEISWVVLMLPIWAFLAQVCWRLVPLRVATVAPGPAREIIGLVVIWLLAIAVLIVAGLLGYASQRRLQTDQARLFLQDVVWQETGREQRRVTSELAWIRKKGGAPWWARRRRKEKR